MKRLARVLLLLGLIVIAAANAPAAEAPPTVVGMISSADRLLEHLQFLLSLTDRSEQREWENVEGVIQTFLPGIATDRPIRIDLILEEGTRRYRPSFPIADFDEFRRVNLEDFGITTRRLKSDLYRCEGDFEGYLRFAHGYATFGEKRADLPSTLPDPAAALAPLLAKGYDFAAFVTNDRQGMESRRHAMQELRENLLAGLKRQPDEDEQTFALRQALARHRLEQAERFAVEAARVAGGLSIDQKSGEARGELELSALPDTSLAVSISHLSTQPSRFAGIPRQQNPVLSGRLVYPLDELRQRQLLEAFTLLRPVVKKRIEAFQDFDADEKTNSNKVADLVLDMLEAGTRMGIIDGFVEMNAAEQGAHTAVAGIRVASGDPAREIIALLPQARRSLKVRSDLETHAGVTLHAISVPQKYADDFRSFFGSDTTIYVGIEAEAVWLAAGHDALTALKKAIDDRQAAGTAEEAKPQPVFAALEVQCGPFIELLDRFRQREQEPKEAEARAAWKRRNAVRNMALEAFKAGDDRFSLEAKRVEDRVEGHAVFHKGLLRFVGKLIADFSKNNL